MDAYAETAMGALGWKPSDFWSATPFDFWAAARGYKRANTPRDKQEASKPPTGSVLNGEDVRRLRARLNEEKRKEGGG